MFSLFFLNDKKFIKKLLNFLHSAFFIINNFSHKHNSQHMESTGEDINHAFMPVVYRITVACLYRTQM